MFQAVTFDPTVIFFQTVKLCSLKNRARNDYLLLGLKAELLNFYLGCEKVDAQTSQELNVNKYMMNRSL
jgi:hypothetical protein